MATLVAGALLGPARTALAGGTPEQACQKGRYAAAAKYNACEQKAIGNVFGGDIGRNPVARHYRCRVKYTATWAKLQSKASGSGSTCDNPRYEDNGDGTVTDRLTGLQWEQKTDDATVHDKNNHYSWSASDRAFGSLPPFATALVGSSSRTAAIPSNTSAESHAGRETPHLSSGARRA